MAKNSVVLIGIAVMLLLDLVVASRIWLHFPTNHWSYEVRWLYLVCVALLAISVVAIVRERSVNLLPAIGTSLSLASSMGIFVIDHYNILVQYEVWLRRGMPSFGS